jgi:hypothetical protein
VPAERRLDDLRSRNLVFCELRIPATQGVYPVDGQGDVVEADAPFVERCRRIVVSDARDDGRGIRTTPG